MKAAGTPSTLAPPRPTGSPPPRGAPPPASRRALTGALVAAVALVACGGVKLGERTLIRPIAPGPTEAVATAPVTGEASTDGVTASDHDDDLYGPVAHDRIAPSARVAAARATTGCFVADLRPFDRAAPSDGPVDPWRAIAGGRPRVLPHAATPYVEPDDARCDAAHDHCLLDCAWIVTTDVTVTARPLWAAERWATADGFDGLAESDAFIAYRSLPVTRDNLELGAIALVSEGPPHPGSSWLIGEVEAIDWAEGTLRLRDRRQIDRLAFARVAAVVYQRGTTAAVANGLDGDRLAIGRDELILPR